MERSIDFVVRVKKSIYQQYIAARGRSRQAMEDKLRRCRKVDQVSKLIRIEGRQYRYIILRNPKAGRPKEDEFIVSPRYGVLAQPFSQTPGNAALHRTNATSN